MNVRDSFREQATGCDALGSPFTARLLLLLADRLEAGTPVADRILEWKGDASYRTDVVGLRVAGALHALVLSNEDTNLESEYPPNSANDDALWNAVSLAFQTHESHILDWLEQPPQTNEVRRCAALIPAFLTLQQKFDLPLALYELGASGGLNMNWDKFSLELNGVSFAEPNSPVRLAPDWAGPLPPNVQPKIHSKAACDINPLDPVQDEMRLRAYIWADQTERLARTAAAIRLAVKAGTSVEKSDALPWLQKKLSGDGLGHLRVIYHTVAWQYFPSEIQDACARVIEQAGQHATDDNPVAWVGMEEDGVQDGAGLTVQIWPTGQRFSLGRADFHGRWVRWSGLQD